MTKPDLTRITLKDWALEDRPREKLLMKGATALSDSELLAILIGSGNREETAVEVCKRVLKSADNDLNKLARFGVNDLKRTKGIGPAKAITIIAALELGRRRKDSEVKEIKKISLSVFKRLEPRRDMGITFEQIQPGKENHVSE